MLNDSYLNSRYEAAKDDMFFVNDVNFAVFKYANVGGYNIKVVPILDNSVDYIDLETGNVLVRDYHQTSGSSNNLYLICSEKLSARFGDCLDVISSWEVLKKMYGRSKKVDILPTYFRSDYVYMAKCLKRAEVKRLGLEKENEI